MCAEGTSSGLEQQNAVKAAKASYFSQLVTKDLQLLFVVNLLTSLFRDQHRLLWLLSHQAPHCALLFWTGLDWCRNTTPLDTVPSCLLQMFSI